MIQGVLTLMAGFRLMMGRAELRSVLWRMIGLLMVLMLVTAFGSFYLLEYMADMWLPQGDAWYWQLLAGIVWVLALILSLISGALAYVVLGSAAVAPWLDMLAAQTEQYAGIETREQQQSWIAQAGGSLTNSVRPLLGLLAWGALALVLIWIPPVATVIWIYAGIRFLSYELMDTTASRQGWDFARRREDTQQRRWFHLGFAGVAMLLLMVPVLNLFVIPAGVVALASERSKDQ